MLKKVMRIVTQLFILWLLNEAGSIIVQFLHIPLPGNVVGMVLCFILLMTGIIKLDWIDMTASFLIKHLAFFFIPISVGLMTLGGVFMQKGLILISILCISAIGGIWSTGYLSQLFMKKAEENVHEQHHSL